MPDIPRGEDDGAARFDDARGLFEKLNAIRARGNVVEDGERYGYVEGVVGEREGECVGGLKCGVWPFSVAFLCDVDESFGKINAGVVYRVVFECA